MVTNNTAHAIVDGDSYDDPFFERKIGEATHGLIPYYSKCLREM